MAQQFSKRAEKATTFQCALSTNCVTHVLQTLTDLDDRATVVSVDGIGAYDLISRQAMSSGLRDMEYGEELMPFVSAFYSSPSTYLWEDELGAVHEIRQGEGGELPMLFSLGQHPAWWRSQANEKLFAFLEDICVVCTPGLRRRSGPVDSEVWDHTRKTKVWNRAGEEPPRLRGKCSV